MIAIVAEGVMDAARLETDPRSVIGYTLPARSSAPEEGTIPTDPTTIAIPAAMLPGDGRFGSGPSKVRAEAVDALAADASHYLGTSHRRQPVRAVVADIRAGIAELYGLDDGREVVLGVGGATAFWDAAAFCLIARRSQHLVLGEFSAKFADAVATAPHLEEPERRTAAPGSAATADPGSEVDAFALIHNETSTGVMPPVERPPRPEALVLVDATSAAGATTVDIAATDAYYFSPQKAFGSEGGLWLAILSSAAIDRAMSLDARRSVPPFLSLAIAIDNSRQDQTYNTPALATLHLLRSQLRWMAGNGGLSWAAARSARSSAIVYDWAERASFATPYVAEPALRSTTTVTVDLTESAPAADVAAVLGRHGIVDIEGYRKLGRNQLRIATFPSVEPEDVARLTAAIDYVVEAL